MTPPRGRQHLGPALPFTPGADYYTRLRPDRTERRAIGQLEAMGYTVTLDRAS